MDGPPPIAADSLQDAEKKIAKSPYAWSLMLREAGTGTYKDISEDTVRRFREELLKWEPSSITLDKITITSSLLRGLKGASVTYLTMKEGSLIASPEEVNLLIASLESLAWLDLENVSDVEMYANLHSCFCSFSGRLGISQMIFWSRPFSKLFMLGRITKLQLDGSNGFHSELDKKRFFRSLSLSKSLKSAFFNTKYLDGLLPSTELVKSVDNENQPLWVEVETSKSLFTVQFPENLKIVSFGVKQSQLSKPIFKSLIGRISRNKFPEYSSSNVEPFTKEFLCKVLNK